jgi:transposase
MSEEKPSVYVGIDVAKAEFVVASEPEGLSLTAVNSPRGYRELLERLSAYDVKLVVMEATGGYERRLAAELVSAGFATVVINPRRVKRYAEAVGQNAKTDRIDARVIARFAEAVKPQPRPAPTAEVERLSELVLRRQQVMGLKTQEENRLGTAREKFVRASIQRVIGMLDKQIDELNKLIAEAIKSDDEFRQTDGILRSVKGVGPQTSAMLIARLPELGRMNRQQVAALVGVAPYDRQSGDWRGGSHIWGGRFEVRSVLYMAALTAMRENPVIKAFAQRLSASGKAFKVVITACMRKLLVILNTMMRNKAKWQSRNS